MVFFLIEQSPLALGSVKGIIPEKSGIESLGY